MNLNLGPVNINLKRLFHQIERNVFSIVLQCSGEAQYVNDRPKVEGELQAYCVLSTQARAKIDSVDTDTAMVSVFQCSVLGSVLI